MTSPGTRRPHPVDTSGDPLTFALSGLMAEPPGTVREYAIERVDVDPGDGLVLAEPVSGHDAPVADEPRPHRRRPPDDRDRRRVLRAASGRS